LGDDGKDDSGCGGVVEGRVAGTAVKTGAGN
jgi:hypothetical protein